MLSGVLIKAIGVYVLARLAVMLGGRCGEETAIGEITSGAENDLLQATGLARRRGRTLAAAHPPGGGPG